MNVSMGLRVEAQTEVTYGPLRRAAASYFNIEPADVTADQAAQFERETGWGEL